MIREEPYFMSNRNWYTTPEDFGSDDVFFEDGRGYHICDDAPEEAKRSYAEFYAEATVDVEGKTLRIA